MDETLLKAIKSTYDELHLTAQDSQFKKILEFKEQLDQRMGVVVVGPSGSGLHSEINFHRYKVVNKNFRLQVKQQSGKYSEALCRSLERRLSFTP